MKTLTIQVVFTVAVALLCIIVVVASTPFGLGVSPDSVMYLSAARSLNSGNGLQALQWTGVFSFMGHFPPILSLLLSIVPELIQKNAVVMQVGLLIASSYLVLLITRKITKDELCSRITQVVTVLSYPVLYVHSQVWSEPLMMLSILAIVLLLMHYNENRKHQFLVSIVVITMFLPLIRYATLYMIPLVWGYIILIENGWTLTNLWLLFKKKEWVALLQAKGKYLLLLLLLLAPYVLWQKYVGLHQAIVRPLSWHPITIGTALQGVNTLVGWFIPIYLGKIITYLAAAVLFLLLLFGIFRVISTKLFTTQAVEDRSILLIAGPVLIYVLFLIVSISLFDAATPLDNRIIAPVFPLIVIVILSLWGTKSNKKVIDMGLKALVLLFVVTTLAKGGLFIVKSNKNGQEYADTQWQFSQTIQAVKELDSTVFIVSNSREGIYSMTGRSAATLPKIVDTQGKRSQSFPVIMQSYMKPNTCIVYFKRIFWNSSKLPIENDIRSFGPYSSIKQYKDGTIYCTK